MTWWLFMDEPTQCGRFCRECATFLAWDGFYVERKGRNGRDSVCKACKVANVSFCSRYRRQHAAPPACQGCGRAGPVEVDHDHDVPLNDGAFRAWLCRRCNRHARRWERVHEGQ